MRIATWNVNSLKARLPRVEEWLADVAPDVVCLQETKLADGAFPALAFEALGYEAVHHGEGRWNGVAIVSRVGIADVVAGFGEGDDDPEARLLWATCGGVRIASAYVPNGRALDHDHYRYKLAWLDKLRARLDAHEDPGAAVVVAGDFNIAPTDEDVWDPAQFVAATHTSAPEREALARIEELAKETFFDARGGIVPLLEPEDVTALSVKRGSLTPSEYEEISSHVTHTFRFLSQIPWGKHLRRVPLIAGAHHERLNGTGYPHRLRAEEIPVQSKLMSIADIFDALTASDRPYKRAVPVERALDILDFSVKDGHVDGELVRIFRTARVWERAQKNGA